MSRIGKTPVLIPEKVTVDFDGLTVTVKGPKGELKRLMPEGVSFDKKDNTVVVNPGEFYTVPRGVEHKPTAKEETHLLLFEPLETKHTGDVVADITVEEYEEI